MTTFLRRKEPQKHTHCVACGASNVVLRLDLIGGETTALCFDFKTCCLRYRVGMTPTQFSLFHRGVQAVSLAR